MRLREPILASMAGDFVFYEYASNDYRLGILVTPRGGSQDYLEVDYGDQTPLKLFSFDKITGGHAEAVWNCVYLLKNR
jgi:hypothetical protein